MNPIADPNHAESSPIEIDRSAPTKFETATFALG